MTDKTDMTIEVSYETESSAPLTVSNGQDVYTQIKVINIFLSDFSFQANVHYQLEMYFPKLTLTNANQYEVYDQQNDESCSISYKYSIFVEDYPRFNFQCSKNTNSVYIKIYNSSNSNITEMGTFQWQYSYLRYTDTSISTDNTDMSDNIINNDNKNTDKVIDNDNKNTDKIIEANKKNFESCRDSYNLSSLGSYTINFANSYYVNKLLLSTFENNTTYTLSFDITASLVPFSISIGYGDDNYRLDTLFYSSSENNGHKVITFTTNDNTYSILWIRIPRYSIPSNVDAEITNIMLVKGNSERDYEKYGEKVCTNRIDETNNKLDDVNKSLNDDTIDSSSANSFFDSFSSTDHGGISGIITAPLVAIKKMLDKNCSPLSATYKGKKIELPCGYDFWSKMTAIKEFINLTLGGLLCYNIIRKLFKLIESMKNPDDDRVEVMKL